VVLDFGLARDEEEGRTITLTGALLGTPGYMAPEQTAPGAPRLDRRVDVYALGVSLFEALTLMHPFEAPTMDAAARAGLRHEPRDLRQLDPRFPKDLALIVATAMRRDRDRRFVTALALAEDLRAFRLGRRIATRPPGVVRRLRDWAALHPATASASAVAAVSLVAVLSVTLHLNTELRTALGDAHAANDRSLELVRFMIGDLTAQLSAIGKTQLLEAVAAKAAAHFETVDLDRLSPDGLATMADAWSTLGRAYELGGLRKKQYECREKAFAILERLGPGVEEDESRAALVAAFHAWRARRAQGTGRLEAGLAEYRMADARLSSISGTPHYDTTARNEHLMTLLALGMLERRLAVPGSLETIRRAKETGDRLVAEVPDNSNIRVEAENAAYQLAVSLDDEGRLTPALALAEEAARRARAFRDEHADQPFARAALADTLLRLSDLLLDSGATEAARAAAAESRDMYVELHALDPSFIRWTNFNVMAHARLVRALLAGRRVAEALEVTRVLRPLVDDARKVEAVASDPWAQTEVSSVLRTCAAAHRDAGLAAEAMEELDAAGALVEKASRAAPNELFARLAVIRQRQELAAWLCDTAPADDAAERRTRAARALALLGEADAVATAGKAGGVASVRFERDRAFILRLTARARRLGGDDAGAVTALDEAVRIRDALAARDPAYVARLADLDTLLADARAAAK
jgi:tetratricopeptide (TPR) repeat protein